MSFLRVLLKYSLFYVPCMTCRKKCFIRSVCTFYSVGTVPGSSPSTFLFFSVYTIAGVGSTSRAWKPHAKYNLGWCCWIRVGLLALVEKPIGKDHQSKSYSTYGKLWIELNAGNKKRWEIYPEWHQPLTWIFRERKKRLKLTFWIYFFKSRIGCRMVW